MSKLIELMKITAEKNHLDIDFNNPQLGLRELKIDSLASINLIMQLEDELGVILDDDVLINIKTLQDLITAFENITKK